jgi:AcrR family transcriptional regulator
MGITERKEKQKLEIRKMILDASMKLFVEHGYENVTIRKIADIIEYSPTTVYLYFKDKDEIFYQLHEIGFKRMTEFNQVLATIENPLVRLHKMGDNYLDFGLENPEYYDVMFILHAPMKALMERDDCEWHEGDSALNFLKVTIQEAMDKGFVYKGNVEAASMAVWGMVHGMVSLAIRQRFNKLMPEDQIRNMMHQALNWFLNAVDHTVQK